MKKILFLIFVLLLGFTPANAEYNNKIHVYNPQVIDGDTIKITLAQGDYKIRLTGIDCFESNDNPRLYQQMSRYELSYGEVLRRGNDAKRLLNSYLKTYNKEIWFKLIGLDKKYGRLVGIIYYRDKNGTFVNINDKMKNSGYCPAYVYRQTY